MKDEGQLKFVSLFYFCLFGCLCICLENIYLHTVSWHNILSLLLAIECYWYWHLLFIHCSKKYCCRSCGFKSYRFVLLFNHTFGTKYCIMLLWLIPPTETGWDAVVMKEGLRYCNFNNIFLKFGHVNVAKHDFVPQIHNVQSLLHVESFLSFWNPFLSTTLTILVPYRAFLKLATFCTQATTNSGFKPCKDQKPRSWWMQHDMADNTSIILCLLFQPTYQIQHQQMRHDFDDQPGWLRQLPAAA